MAQNFEKPDIVLYKSESLTTSQGGRYYFYKNFPTTQWLMISDRKERQYPIVTYMNAEELMKTVKGLLVAGYICPVGVELIQVSIGEKNVSD